MLGVVLFSACSDGPGAVSRDTKLVVVQAPSGSAHSAAPLQQQPVVALEDAAGEPVARRGVTVRAQLVSGSGSLSNATAVTDSSGQAAFTALSITGAVGAYGLQFSADGMTSSPASTVAVEETLCESGGVLLDMPLGGFQRFITTQQSTPRCLEFHATQNAGQQYLVMFENIPRNGDFSSALFPGSPSESELKVSVGAAPAQSATYTSLSSAMRKASVLSNATSESPSDWDFGSGRIYEGNPPQPPAGVSTRTSIVGGPSTAGRAGSGSAGSSGLTSRVRDPLPAVGDTIEMYLEGISRLGIPSGTQRAVVRFISDDLVFAEDVRLGTTLLRPDGTNNRPLTVAQMDTLAREYAAYARVQGDQFFTGRFNTNVEAQSSHVTVVHTLMYDDNVWGYTYSHTNYFAFDYWVGNTGGKNRFNNQILQRVADDLFMHEIAHIRHYGMLERASRQGKRGNQWLTEGFARFTERLPIAMRLLGSTNPSRTSNFVLNRNPAFNGSYFFDDVPTYLEAGSSLFDGYQSSSYLFDYFADQVASRGGDHQAAVRDLVLNAGVESELDAAVGRWMPGWKFGELVTRARVALYTDDYGVGLPGWTQYHQYQLRESRPSGSRTAQDPRNKWPKIAPGAIFAENRSIAAGTAFGYIIDGTSQALDTRVLMTGTAAPNVVMSITRIR